MSTEDNVEVVSDYPLEEEGNQMENDTPENEELIGEAESSETEKSQNQRELETLLAQKEHWRRKYQELEKKVPATREAKVEKSSEGDDEFKHRVEFLLENRDLNAQEYDHLAAVALRESGKITLDALRDAREGEREYISYLRKKAENKAKAPGSTSASSLSKFEKSAEEIRKMTPEEHRQYDEQMMRGSTRLV